MHNFIKRIRIVWDLVSCRVMSCRVVIVSFFCSGDVCMYVFMYIHRRQKEDRRGRRRGRGRVW